MNSQTRRLLGKFLIVVLVINCLSGLSPILTTVHAQQQHDRIIIINAEQPNVWTLEQAHYLLAQMRQRNLDLRAKHLENLDANEINGLQFDVLRTLVELGVEFNDANRVTNSMLRQNRNFNTGRRQTLLTRRDTLSDKPANLMGEITGLKIEQARAKTQEDKDRLDAEITAKTSQREAVDKQIESIDNELKTLNEPTGDFKETIPQVNFDPNKLPKSAFDEAFAAAAKQQIENFNKTPQLNATLRLENFLQMQYEIIAKQLTLLRDEVGPGERLLFLELPQTVNVTSNEGNNKWAQSWWRIAGYMRRKKAGVDAKEAPSQIPPSMFENQMPVTTTQDYNNILRGKEIIVLRQGDKENNDKGTKQTSASTKYINEFVKLDKITPPKIWKTLKTSKSIRRSIRTGLRIGW